MAHNNEEKKGNKEHAQCACEHQKTGECTCKHHKDCQHNKEKESKGSCKKCK